MSRLLLLFIWVCCITLATWLGPIFSGFKTGSGNASVMVMLLGESRQMFANQLFAKADAYFHSGNYPTIFDTPQKKQHSEQDHQGEHHDEDGHDEDAHVKAFLPGQSHDWIESFGRNFIYKGHSHLEDGNEREMLPWLKLAADMDPHQVGVYATTAYWLRERLNKADEAEHFLRQGLLQNPDSFELYNELAITILASKKDHASARRLWQIARSKWLQADAAGTKPDTFVYEQILGHLAQLEKADGNAAQQILWLEELKKIAPNPQDIEKLIREAKSQPATH